MSFANHFPENLFSLSSSDDSGYTTVMLCAFEGWNDAGSAATETLTYLERIYSAQELSGFESEDFYDFTTNRPLLISQEDGTGEITWPSISMHRWTDESRRIHFITVTGPEPQLRWHTFVAALMGAAREFGVDHIVLLGALLAEVPHTQVFPVNVTSYSPALRENDRVHQQSYTGPTGIIGVLAHAARQYGISDLSLWVSIPHYAGHPPHPKATLELLRGIESLFSLAIPLRTIEEETHAWERGAAELMEEEPELAAYVKQLESDQENSSLENMSGEDIAAEFERFLKRRDG
ncbi:PAC2 family protein [Rothia amarae]|uniref:PAC2 family protein n=1 Tax=Rothia amarae TaxID=169480 RepID=UPI001248FD78